MLLFFIEWYQQTFSTPFPAVFSYYSTRIMLAAITSMILTILLGPRLIKKLYELRIGQQIRMEECPLLGKLHEKKKNTPTMGGVLILCSMLASLFLWMDLKHVFTLILLFTTVSLGAVGAVDDYLKLKRKSSQGLSARRKFLMQGGITALVVSFLLTPVAMDALGSWFHVPKVKETVLVRSSEGEVQKEGRELSFHESLRRIYVPFIKNPVLTAGGVGVLFLAGFFCFVMIGSSNAVNLTDGLDGLAGGSLVLASSALALVAFVSNNVVVAHYLNILYIDGSGEIGIYLAALAGACLGFLWYNGYPAQVFMGDTGSLALGGILGVSVLLLRREFLLALVGGIFVAETLSVILQVLSYRLRGGKRVFLCSPLHHHFEYKGWAETKVVLRFWIVGLLLAILGVASLKVQ